MLKKYEKELNSNSVNKVTIDRLRIENNDLINKCKQLEKEKLHLLEKTTNLDYKLKNNLMRKLEKYKDKYKKCLNELRNFDEKFFDEIEDVKYYLNESLKLNEYYERMLHICDGDGKKLNDKFQKLSIYNSDSHDLYKDGKEYTEDLVKRKSFISERKYGLNQSISTIKSIDSCLYDQRDGYDSDTDNDDDSYQDDN